MIGEWLREEYEGDVKAELFAEDCRGEGVVRTRGPDCDQATRAAQPGGGEQELQLPNLVAAVGLRGKIVTLDKDVGATDAERLYGRRKIPELNPRYSVSELRIPFE